MMTRGFIVAAVLATALLTSAGPSWAGFKVCNHSDEKISVSIGYKSSDYGWTSEGWWSAAPGDCTRILTGDLNQRYYYVYATGDDGGLWAARKGEQDGGFFCMGKRKYTFHNGDFQKNNAIDCEASGQTTKQFVEVDTKGATEFTYDLEK